MLLGLQVAVSEWPQSWSLLAKVWPLGHWTASLSGPVQIVLARAEGLLPRHHLGGPVMGGTLKAQRLVGSLNPLMLGCGRHLWVGVASQSKVGMLTGERQRLQTVHLLGTPDHRCLLGL